MRTVCHSQNDIRGLVRGTLVDWNEAMQERCFWALEALTVEQWTCYGSSCISSNVPPPLYGYEYPVYAQIAEILEKW